MKIVLLDGSPAGVAGDLTPWGSHFAVGLKARGHDVEHVVLRDMELHPCTGCFACWLRTPGRCIIPDDAESLCRSFIAADLVISLSPLIMGLFSALLKKALDRMVPLVLPHLTMNESGEMHHHPRYGRRPMLAAVVGEEPDTSPQDLEIVRCFFERNALNLAAPLLFFGTCSREGEIFDAIDRL